MLYQVPPLTETWYSCNRIIIKILLRGIVSFSEDILLNLPSAPPTHCHLINMVLIMTMLGSPRVHTKKLVFVPIMYGYKHCAHQNRRTQRMRLPLREGLASH